MWYTEEYEKNFTQKNTLVDMGREDSRDCKKIFQMPISLTSFLFKTNKGIVDRGKEYNIR